MTCRFTKICVLLLCSVFALTTFAQNNNSGIKGTVQDTHGAVVPGATVDLTNVGTGQQLSTTSGQDGFYDFTNLSPANYKVTVSAPGFAGWVGVLTLRVSQSALVDPRMNAASVATQVTVKDVTPVIDQVNPTLSDVKEATRIETLPVQNRSILNVLAFSPGVVAGNYGGSGAGYTRVNGVPGGSMDYLVDGQTMANRWSNELQSNPQPIPTFQEVKIISANGDAQYATPGVVELVTKSGTNHFHGQLFELNKNNILQARTFNSGPSIPYLMHNEYGGQLGGPVWIPKIYNGKNKTFFFVDIEGIREDKFASNQQFTLPTAQQKTGDLSGFIGPDGVTPLTFYDPSTTRYDPATGAYTRDPFPGNKIPVNQVSAKVLSFLPDPNVNVPYYEQPNYTSPNASASIRNKLYTAKVDQLFGPNRLAMRYTYTDSNSVVPGYLLNPNVVESGGHNGAITFTEVIGPKAINIVRAGLQYNHNLSGPQPISPSIPTQLGLPNYQDSIAWPAFYYNGYYGSFTGIDRNNPKDYPDQTIVASDQFSYNKGNHQLMAGVIFQNYRVNTFEVGQPGGSYAFDGNFTALQDPAEVANGVYDVAVKNSGGNANDGGVNPTGSAGFASFLLGDSSGVILNTYPHYHTRQTQYSGYVQDDWRATQRLTLNLGVRYTYWTPFSDSTGLQSTFDTSVPGGRVVYKGNGALPAQTSQDVFEGFKAAGLPIVSAATAGFPLSLWNMPKNNWDPRLGFAYQIGNNKVLRGGWGIYHWAIPLQQYQQATRKNAPFSFTSLIQPGEVDGAPTDVDAAELEFPIATPNQYASSPNYGGPNANLNYWMLGSPTLVLDTANVSVSEGAGFNMAPMDVNYKASTVQEYNLTFEQELPGHFGLQLSYIGNHSYHLLQLDPINARLPRELCPSEGLPANCNDTQRRAFPVFQNSSTSAMDLYRYDGYSNTNELQAQIQRNFGNGLTIQSYFTWQRTLTTTEDGLLGTAALEVVPAALTPGFTLTNFASGAPYSERQRAVYAPDSTLPNKTFSINGHYEFPFGKGKKYLGNSHGFVNALVSGYNISPFFLWHSGLYFSPFYSSQGSATILAPGKTGILPESQRTTQHWFDYQPPYNPASGQPYAGQTYEIKADSLGGDFRNNIPRDYMTGPGFNELDATIYKLTPLGKGTMLDIEAQIFNVYNHQNLALPTGLPANSKGIITAPLTGSLPRIIQLQAKFLF